MLRVYGIIDGREIRGPTPRGHDGDVVEALPVENIAAVVSRAIPTATDVSAEHVWAHEKVLNALMAYHVVLPMRFGTMCAAGELASDLDQRRSVLEAALQRLAGKAEMALRIVHDEVPEVVASFPPPQCRSMSGTSYLMARAADLRRADDDRGPPPLRAIRGYLDRRAIETHWQFPVKSGEPVKASCLVAKCRVSDFVDGLAEFDRPEIRLSCTGPWAPYSFVGVRLGKGGGR